MSTTPSTETKMPERIELPGGFSLTPSKDGTYALYGFGSKWQIGCVGVEAVKEFAAAMQSNPLAQDGLREALQRLVDLRAQTDMTHEDAYDSMFKRPASEAWEFAKLTLAANLQAPATPHYQSQQLTNSNPQTNNASRHE